MIKSDWQVNLLRMTAFPSPDIKVVSQIQDLWEKVIGIPPENVSSSPRSGESIVSGGVDIGHIIITQQLGRIDFVLKQEESPSINIPTLGRFTEIINPFIDYVDKIFSLSFLPSLNRLAFGSILYSSTENKKNGYELLSEYLPSVTIDPINSSDLLYKINRPRKSQTNSKWLINRLSTWSVITNVLYSIPLTPISTLNTTAIESKTGCLLELDINTSQEITENIEQEVAARLFRELIELAKEVANEGDIK